MQKVLKKKKIAKEFFRNKLIFVPVLHYFSADNLKWFLDMPSCISTQTNPNYNIFWCIYYILFALEITVIVFPHYGFQSGITVAHFFSGRWKCNDSL